MLKPTDIIIEMTAIAGESFAESTLLARVKKEAVERECLGVEYLSDIAIFTANFPVDGDFGVKCPNNTYRDLDRIVAYATYLPENCEIVDEWRRLQTKY